MSQKPENQYISSVNRYVPREVYRVHISNPYVGGIPDEYYENRRILWVEYKFTPRLPPLLLLTDLSKKPCLSKLQQDWLERCHNNGHQVAVVLGSPEGGLIFEGTEWKEQISREVAIKRRCNRREIAGWITYKVGLDPESVYRLGHC